MAMRLIALYIPLIYWTLSVIFNIFGFNVKSNLKQWNGKILWHFHRKQKGYPLVRTWKSSSAGTSNFLDNYLQNLILSKQGIQINSHKQTGCLRSWNWLKTKKKESKGWISLLNLIRNYMSLQNLRYPQLYSWCH